MTNVSNQIPKHVGVILDGNRRWAKQHNLPTLDGHRQGAEVFKKVALAAFDRGVEYLSGYIFSTENWRRTEEEVAYLMKLVVKGVEQYLDEFHKRGIKIVCIGRKDQLSSSVLKSIKKTEEKTKDNDRGVLVLCFNYGGHQEIIDATKAIIREGIAAEDIDESVFSRYIYHPEIPPVDLLIRTSGEQRTSGFMLWRADYAELIFSQKLWPDFGDSDLAAAIDEYIKRKRRFGG